MFGAGIKDKAQGEDVVEGDINDDEIIFIIERNIDSIQVFPDDDIGFLGMQGVQPAKKQGVKTAAKQHNE